MPLQSSCLLSFLIVVICSLPCYGVTRYIHDVHGGTAAYDSKFNLRLRATSTDDGDDGATFENLIKQSTDVLSMKMCGDRSAACKLKTVNVDDFGAKGDGRTDDTQAFDKAWKEACFSSQEAVLMVPKKSYLLKPIRFSGPCKSSTTVRILGTLEASDNPSDYDEDRTHWLRFESVEGLTVDGGGSGTINGNGKFWWENSCKINTKLPCKNAPTAVTFYGTQNLTVKNLNIRDSQQIHVTFEDSMNVQVSGLTVAAPEDSPNTDGIHVTNTQNIQISACTIGTGDDCISIVDGSRNVEANDITCGPGHGISIGSLGAGNSKEFVSGITVNGAKISGTKNGVRIKTWQGGSGTASNIKFQNIKMTQVENPIIIDQSYCDQKTPCKQQGSAVQIRNVVYQNIQGSSATDVAVALNCSESFPCQGVVLQNINLVAQGRGVAKALCENVKYTAIGDVSPRCT